MLKDKLNHDEFLLRLCQSNRIKYKVASNLRKNEEKPGQVGSAHCPVLQSVMQSLP